ncbi:hypothetical protein VTJ49DRAFT_7179 [Mycothermus thermophilus]|uniref:MARVEL domain-containing protein n=1 Tax=Humicola insolens TaxID=85995 RepID=A0ABR3VRD4_HUMIN
MKNNPGARDPLSLRPQGVYGYAFIAARVGEIVANVVIVGILSHFIHTAVSANRAISVPLVVILTFSALSLLWTLVSCTGYSRRCMAYKFTWIADLVLLIPFLVLAILLGRPLDGVQCAAVSSEGGLAVGLGPSNNRATAIGSDEDDDIDFDLDLDVDSGSGSGGSGVIHFPTDGRTTCTLLMAVWGLLLVLCILFPISALAVKLLETSEKGARAGKASLDDASYSSYSDQGSMMSEASGEGVGEGRNWFRPTPRAVPGPGEQRMMYPDEERGGYDDAPDPVTAAERSSAWGDQLILNRPVTLGPDMGYGPMSQPPPVMMAAGPYGRMF